MYLSFFTFAILSVFAYRQFYVIPVGKSRFREDGHALLFVASMWVGGWVMLAFTTLCYIAIYSFMRLRQKMKYRPLNLILIAAQALAVYLVLGTFERLMPTHQPLTLFLTMSITVFLTQLTTVLVSSLLFQISLRVGNWKRVLLKYALMDSIYLTLYVIATSYTSVVEVRPLWRFTADIVTIASIVGLYYWRTVGIKQDRKVEVQVEELKALNTQIAHANQQVLLAFASSLEKRDPYTAGHSERVAQYAVYIAEELGMSTAELKVIHLGGLLHDIGKIGIPDHVLNKPDRLTVDEYDIMKQHPVIGEELLRGVYTASQLLNDSERERMLEIVLSHHERPDGRGYPFGLIEEQIPLFAKITAVADAYDAMTSNRAYRNAMSKDQAARILDEGKGTQFWTPAVDAFLRVLEHQQLEPDVDTLREVSASRAKST
ncbi:HD-GYP domain-containing protein [Tumebacillus permanentifrigoris]|uniref:Putative nucleotidyltransferase with HDIG domain n=1 Tax=Tumebacillus permanentifrigoris TaxID=378543 RepID=A0A316DEB3_9BACL|nr:HD-GYP domain-containing protein [Tumebacillus permanentifrigoris]PWK15882.1 putative nucleotidyltransferase with HDIG domain [Tumebacillus permanentifrigoris]